jgi:hypothetical protein
MSTTLEDITEKMPAVRKKKIAERAKTLIQKQFGVPKSKKAKK